MSLSDDLSQLIQGLRHAGASGRQLQFDLLRHLTECVQQLTSSLEEDVMLPSDNAAPDGTREQLAEAPSEEENIVRAPESLESPGGLALPFPHKSSITVRLFVSSGQLSLAWLSEYLGYFDLTGMVCDLR